MRSRRPVVFNAENLKKFQRFAGRMNNTSTRFSKRLDSILLGLTASAILPLQGAVKASGAIISTRHEPLVFPAVSSPCLPWSPC